MGSIWISSVSLDPFRGEAVQSSMRYVFAFTFFCLAFLSLDLVIDAEESQNPLQGSLRDPWKIVTEENKPTLPSQVPVANQNFLSSSTDHPKSSFGPSFADFKSHYTSSLDLSSLTKANEDSVASRYARGGEEWDHFHPKKTDFPVGMIFYGDPSLLARSHIASTTTIDKGRWPLSLTIAAIFLILLLIGIYCRMQYQRYSSLTS